MFILLKMLEIVKYLYLSMFLKGTLNLKPPSVVLGEGSGERLDLCELENAPEMENCPKTFVHDCRFICGTRPTYC